MERFDIWFDYFSVINKLGVSGGPDKHVKEKPTNKLQFILKPQYYTEKSALY